MSYLTATYDFQGTKDVIQVPLDTSLPLTGSIVKLQAEINTYLTKIMAGEIQIPVTTVEQDERDQELQEMEAEEEDEEADLKMGDAEEEEGEDSDKQNVKKQRTDL